MNPTRHASDLTFGDEVSMAEREFSAFFAAVETLFGPTQAKLSAEDWLNVTKQMDRQNHPTHREWRAVTIAASSRLAQRVVAAR